MRKIKDPISEAIKILSVRNESGQVQQHYNPDYLDAIESALREFRTCNGEVIDEHAKSKPDPGVSDCPQCGDRFHSAVWDTCQSCRKLEDV